MKRLILLLFAIPLFQLSAYQWPLAGGYLTASFGENDGGAFLKGIKIAGHGSVVSPFLSGEVIYTSCEDEGLPSVLGNYKVVHHENGFRSIYGNLEKFSKNAEESPFEVTENDQIGTVGNSGRTADKDLFFMIYDMKMHQYVNPQIILPPSGDRIPPVISRVFIEKEGSKTPVELKNRSTVSAGKVRVSAIIYDYGGDSGRSDKTVPYSISLFYLGNEINQIKFDTLKDVDGRYILQGGNPVSYDELYDGDKIRLGEINLNAGQGILEISTADNSQNSRTRTFQLNILP